MLQQCLPFTVLKQAVFMHRTSELENVATVLTVYGIETSMKFILFGETMPLQQCLPFTVLKHDIFTTSDEIIFLLQQCLPFTVLKQEIFR